MFEMRSQLRILVQRSFEDRDLCELKSELHSGLIWHFEVQSLFFLTSHSVSYIISEAESLNGSECLRFTLWHYV